MSTHPPQTPIILSPCVFTTKLNSRVLPPSTDHHQQKLNSRALRQQQNNSQSRKFISPNIILCCVNSSLPFSHLPANQQPDPELNNAPLSSPCARSRRRVPLAPIRSATDIRSSTNISRPARLLRLLLLFVASQQNLLLLLFVSKRLYAMSSRASHSKSPLPPLQFDDISTVPATTATTVTHYQRIEYYIIKQQSSSNNKFSSTKSITVRIRK